MRFTLRRTLGVAALLVTLAAPSLLFADSGSQGDALAFVMAGGKGTRLQPLTTERAKPFVPFLAGRRIIDFVLSNLWNSGLKRIYVPTMYQADSLEQHLAATWPHAGDGFVIPVRKEKPYAGTADSIRANWDLVAKHDPKHVVVFGADHIYAMDVKAMLDRHIASGAKATVAAIPIPIREASEFGIAEVDASGKVIGFLEKPASAPEMPGRAGFALASMGNYVFDRAWLEAELAKHPDWTDFGHDFLPEAMRQGVLRAYDYFENAVPGARDPHYWRDVGTLAAYHDALLDFRNPPFSLDDPRWPIRVAASARSIVGRIGDNLVGEGAAILGKIESSVLGKRVRIGRGAVVKNSVLLDGVTIPDGARVENALIEEGVSLPRGIDVVDATAADHLEGVVAKDGVVAVPRDAKPRTSGLQGALSGLVQERAASGVDPAER